MFALIGAINASNHSDGLDGLAGGEALLSLIAMAALAYVVGDSLVVGVALAAIGGILGFLRYNSHPARVFMGDSGSQVLGFTLGFLAVYLTQVAHTAMSAALPLLLLGLPIADILAVLYLRVRHGRNWFRATRNHVHHRLLDLGFAHYETVVIIYSIHAALVVSAVLLRYEADWLVTLVYFGVVGTLFTALHIAERRGVRRKPAEDRPRLPGVLERFAASELARYSSVSLLGALLLLATSSVSAVPRDFAFAGAGLAAVLLVDALRTRGGGSALTRAANYAAAILVAYLLAFHPAAALPVRLAVIAAIVVLTVAVAIHVRFSRRQEFGATPTDYLVVFGVLALLAFGSIAVDSHATVAFVAAAAALLYGCEVVNGHGAQTGRVLNAATFLAVAVLAFRGAL
jgi:UDP-GlcNAc:undecaprenyl-phosphate GlcNAc-1-phosphate transferase